MKKVSYKLGESASQTAEGESGSQAPDERPSAGDLARAAGSEEESTEVIKMTDPFEEEDRRESVHSIDLTWDDEMGISVEGRATPVGWNDKIKDATPAREFKRKRLELSREEASPTATPYKRKESSDVHSLNETLDMIGKLVGDLSKNIDKNTKREVKAIAAGLKRQVNTLKRDHIKNFLEKHKYEPIEKMLFEIEVQTDKKTNETKQGSTVSAHAKQTSTENTKIINKMGTETNMQDKKRKETEQAVEKIKKRWKFKKMKIIDLKTN
ncbi:hypothetical protein ABEB36_004761 [Hypothenemus hampei]|uniref:Uncharacterized protein n=1 Tax=Hypothenemus hampei TaxID=57062 RepID=A0ABD1EWA1_HYPHA